MVKGYTLDDAISPEYAADYATDKLGIVEETSASATQDIIIYGPIVSSYYCSLDLFYYFLGNILWKRLAEHMKFDKNSYLP